MMVPILLCSCSVVWVMFWAVSRLCRRYDKVSVFVQVHARVQRRRTNFYSEYYQLPGTIEVRVSHLFIAQLIPLFWVLAGPVSDHRPRRSRKLET